MVTPIGNELTSGSPFLRSDLLVHEEPLQLLSYAINLQKALQEYGNKILCAADKDYQHTHVKPGDTV